MDQIMKDIFEHVGRTCEDSPGPGGSSDIGNVNLKIPVFHPLLDITGKDKRVLCMIVVLNEFFIQQKCKKHCMMVGNPV